MFKTLKDKIQRDRDFPERQFDIDILTRVLRGKLYDHLQYPFGQERKDGTDEYIPLRERRPSVRYGLCRIVVDDSVSLLFSEGHWPAIECKDESTRDTLAELVDETNLNQVMIDAATTGSVGSVAIFMRVLSNRVFFEVQDTQYLTPTWKADAPDTLERVTERYKVKGTALKALGYAVTDDDLAADWWFQREWDDTAETWFVPWKVSADDQAPKTDATKTTQHSLGFVPVVWVKNLPGGNGIDGECTFPVEAIETSIEIDYTLSQNGRGLKYSLDPTLMIKEPAVDNDGKMIRGGGNAIVVGAEGDAKMLEINGTASDAVLNYVRCLRELALETAHGNRANADKLSAAQSGRAMELMNQSLIWLADKLRISYGKGGLLELLRMVVQASAKVKLQKKDGTPFGAMDPKAGLTLRWPAWYAPTYADKQTEAQTLGELRDKSLISQETAVKTVATSYDIADPADELRKIKAEPPPPGAAGSDTKPRQQPLAQSDD